MTLYRSYRVSLFAGGDLPQPREPAEVRPPGVEGARAARGVAVEDGSARKVFAAPVFLCPQPI